MQAVIASLRQLTLWSMMLRVVLAMLMGGVIGLDREKKGRPAGFRTYMLVSMGAAATAILSQYLDLMLSTLWAEDLAAVGNRTDVVRLSAQVISGVGFIGTGTIMVTARHEVKGLTTASCLWASACMGLAIGAGFYECMVIGFILILLSNRVLPRLERWIVERARNMNIFVETDSAEHLSQIIRTMKDAGLTLFEIEIDRGDTGAGSLRGNFSVRLGAHQQHTQVLAKLSTLEGVLAVEEV